MTLPKNTRPSGVCIHHLMTLLLMLILLSGCAGAPFLEDGSTVLHVMNGTAEWIVHQAEIQAPGFVEFTKGTEHIYAGPVAGGYVFTTARRIYDGIGGLLVNTYTWSGFAKYLEEGGWISNIPAPGVLPLFIRSTNISVLVLPVDADLSFVNPWEVHDE